MEGRILKGVGGFYYVAAPNGELVTCKARGRFRKEGSTPMVGDLVRAENGMLTEILPRKNELVRPPVSNIDRLVIVLSASRPKPDLLLADKLILSALHKGIEPVIVLNKMDVCDAETLHVCREDYSRCFLLLPVSAESHTGIEELSGILSRGITCFAGQSAVGKSSLMNALIPGIGLETGDLARKTERGRHTTRHAELIPFGEGYLADTPGFSLLDPEDLTQEDLNACMPEFASSPEKCRFPSCSHISEPDCAVKALRNEGLISKGRYERYKSICLDLIERRKHKYD